MGQRLNIEITDNGKVLANAYYHWAAYTSSSIQLTKSILERFSPFDKDDDKLYYAIDLLAGTGAGFNTTEMEKAQVVYPNIDLPIASDRNTGLLSISEEGIEETRSWEEGRVTIDIATKIVDFEVFFRLMADEYEQDYEQDPKTLKEIEFEFHEIPFDEFEKLETLAGDMRKQGEYDFRLKGEPEFVYSFVE